MTLAMRLTALTAALSSTSAFAILPGGTVPEPGSLPLVVLAGVAAVVVARFIKRK
ncbi:PEP-CTERM sorting domain-containing protein [Ideonella sp. DXS22W]|uniref:PEP-CTERM sorting domain-containing protein n=1 Tax=Pseudaquabacterium inlustre TaxID=2984192 RepID=A0ABU9CE94_9BURK